MGNHVEKGKSSNDISMKCLELPRLFSLNFLAVIWEVSVSRKTLIQQASTSKTAENYGDTNPISGLDGPFFSNPRLVEWPS